MSVGTAFSVGKQALRHGVFALATVGTLFAANAANAAEFTQEECKVIYGTARKVVQTVGKDTLSVQFRQSLVNFMGPNTTCDGPKNILTPTVNDVAAYNTIRTILLSPPGSISLQKAGLRAIVNPATVSLNLN